MKKSREHKLKAFETDRQDFKDYLLKEYENIAEAHFRTNEAISSFFRYYLIIMAIPVTIYSAIIGLSPEIGDYVVPLTLLSALISLIIAVIGFCVLFYIINLRMDAILYARNVNAIRKYFYDKAPMDLAARLQFRVLPQTPSLPAYFEWHYFIWVVISFAIFNSIYMFSGLAIFSIPITDILQLTSLNEIFNLIGKLSPLFIGWTLLFFILHIGGYRWIAHHREHTYLKSFTLGIDIDGVINEHRDHFCDLLYTLVGKQLCPEKITTIPIHDDPALGVSRKDEKCVFNYLNYWIDMPPIRSARDNIVKLRNMLGLKIHIFTHRPWPSKEVRESQKYEEWMNKAIKMYKKSNIIIPRLLSKLKRNKYSYKIVDRIINQMLILRMRTNVRRLRLDPLDLITKCWLQSKGFQYDELTIEKGSEDISDPQGKVRNRFYIRP